MAIWPVTAATSRGSARGYGGFYELRTINGAAPRKAVGAVSGDLIALATHRTHVVEGYLTGARASSRGDDSAPGYDVELHLRVHLAPSGPAEERWSSLPPVIAQLCRTSWPSSGKSPHEHYKCPQACDAYPDERECSGQAATDLGPVSTGRYDFQRSTFDDAHRGFTVPRSSPHANRRLRESLVSDVAGRGFEIAPRGQETQGRQSCLLAHAAPAGLFPLAR